jgi:hypothetical protein
MKELYKEKGFELPFWKTDRGGRFKKRTKYYGADPRETWDLPYSFVVWLYPRLLIYLKEAGEIINLDYYEYEVEGQERRLPEIIKEMIELCESILNLTAYEDRETEWWETAEKRLMLLFSTCWRDLGW